MSCPSWQWQRTGNQFEPYRWRPCGVTWDSSRTLSRGNKAAANFRPKSLLQAWALRFHNGQFQVADVGIIGHETGLLIQAGFRLNFFRYPAPRVAGAGFDTVK